MFNRTLLAVPALIFGALSTLGCDGTKDGLFNDTAGGFGDLGGSGGSGVGTGNTGCEVTLPEEMQVVSDTVTLNSAYALVWACAGATVDSNASHAEVYLEPGAVLLNNGSNSLVWAKAGSEVKQNGSNTTTWYEDGAVFDDNASDLIYEECAEIIFNSGPIPGCG